MFSVGAQPWMSLAALPPAPIEAIFSFSLGDLYPSAFREGVLPNPPAGTSAGQQGSIKKVSSTDTIESHTWASSAVSYQN